jgi:3-hydroxyisobutyrate dehydrogenase-like beta-hydroxyacid dehydrogenase
MMQKDIMLALDLSRELGVPLPTTSVTNDLLSAARGLGLANKDFAIIVKVLERMSSMND